MNVVINKDNFSKDNINISNNNKILYNYKSIKMLGIPILITDFDFMIKNNYIILKLMNKNDIYFFESIDTYFSEKYKNYKKSLKTDKIYVKNILNKVVEKQIYVNINSLKQKDFLLYLNIFTL